MSHQPNLSTNYRTRENLSLSLRRHSRVELYMKIFSRRRQRSSGRPCGKKHLSIKVTNCRFKAWMCSRHQHSEPKPPPSSVFWLTGCALSGESSSRFTFSRISPPNINQNTFFCSKSFLCFFFFARRSVKYVFNNIFSFFRAFFRWIPDPLRYRFIGGRFMFFWKFLFAVRFSTRMSRDDPDLAFCWAG